MVILCSKCGHRFESLIIDKEVAAKQLIQKLSDHALAKHRDGFQLLQKGAALATAALGQFMFLDELAIIPEQETFLAECMEKCQDVVMTALGYDAEDDGEEIDNIEDVDGDMPLSDPVTPEPAENLSTESD